MKACRSNVTDITIELPSSLVLRISIHNARMVAAWNHGERYLTGRYSTFTPDLEMLAAPSFAAVNTNAHPNAIRSLTIRRCRAYLSYDPAARTIIRNRGSVTKVSPRPAENANGRPRRLKKRAGRTLNFNRRKMQINSLTTKLWML